MFCGVKLSLLICRLFHDASTVKVTASDTVKEFFIVGICGHIRTSVLFIKTYVCAKKFEIWYTRISALTSRTMFLY